MFLLTFKWVSSAPYHLNRHHSVPTFFALSFSCTCSIGGAPQFVYPIQTSILSNTLIRNRNRECTSVSLSGSPYAPITHRPSRSLTFIMMMQTTHFGPLSHL
jgi:hypothetical protein